MAHRLASGSQLAMPSLALFNLQRLHLRIKPLSTFPPLAESWTHEVSKRRNFNPSFYSNLVQRYDGAKKGKKRP